MNIKHILTTIQLFLFILVGINAQDATGKLAEAKTSYKSGKLDDSRYALQQALNDIDVTIGKDILAILPTKVSTIEYKKDQDQVMGMGSSYTGLYVSRTFGGDDKQNKATLNLMSDSPLLTSINAILAMPAFMTGGDANQKRIKVDGYKSILQKNTSSDGIISYDVQIPFDNSLITFHCEGFTSESDVIAMANTIPITKIAALAK